MKRTKLAGQALIVGLALVTLMGCQHTSAGKGTSSQSSSSQVTKTKGKPYAKELATVTVQATKMVSESVGKQKLNLLKRLEDRYAKYLASKKTYPLVKKAYQVGIKSGKQAFKTQNDQTLKVNTPQNMHQENEDTLQAKNAKLSILLKDVTAQKGIVYNDDELATLTSQIDNHIAANKAQIPVAVLATDNSQKYQNAYEQFTAKGNPVGAGRGATIRASGFYEAVGLTEDEYWHLYSGIFDYYGNAVNRGWITEMQGSDATNKALEMMAKGKYARRSTQINTMNFYLIEQGDYSCLMGSWTEVAEAANHLRGEGTQWQSPSGQKLSISKDRISDEQMTLRRVGTETKIEDQDDSSNVEFNDLDNKPYLSVDADAGAQAWTVSFFPEGVAMEGSGLPSAINTAKERIYIRTSNNDFIEVFQRN